MKRVFSLPNRTHGQGPIYFNWQKGGGNFLVTTGFDHVVSIYNRHGVKVDHISMPGMVTGMEWDKDGDLLGLICDKSPSIVLWDSNSRKISHIDTGLRDALSLILWAKSSPLVAVGTFKGNLLIYNHRSSRKVPVLGKHSKKITAGAWSSQGYLALAGEDRVLTVSNQDGDTLCQTSLKADPALAAFSCMKQDSASTSSAANENTVSLVLNKRTLYLLNIYDPENPILLAFQDKYGYIIDYKWYDDGHILLGFTQGFFVIISTLLKDIGQELFQVRSQKESMTHLAIVISQGKIASCGENTIKVHELRELQEVAAIVTVDEERQLEWLEWTDDGQLLAAAGAEGGLHVFLAKLPALAASWQGSLAFLSSLREVTVVSEPQAGPFKLRLEAEPALLALGPFHLAAGLHNRAWFYCLDQKGPYLLKEREYLGTITSICLNADYASALFEGKIQLHLVEEQETEEKEARLFPDGNFANVHISCHSLTKDFLIYGTDTGQLHYFLLEDWQEVNHFSHSTGIKLICPEPAGVRLILVDDRNQGFVYNPSADVLLAVSEFPSKIKGVLWDQCPTVKGVFIGYDDHSIYTYVETRDTLKGWLVESCGKTKLPGGQFPVLVYSGEVHCQTQSGKMAVLSLDSHLLLRSNFRDSTKQEVKETLERAVKLRDFSVAWGLCQRLDSKDSWLQLAEAATFCLDVELAIRVYRHLGNVSMVWDLRSIKDLEDKSLLAGHLAMFQGDFALAEELYLSSRSPSAALAMRCDLLHWEPALQLARSLAPQQLPFISRQYALQLEFMGDSANALLHYEKGVTNDLEHVEHDNICKMGVARTSIRCNNIQRGFQIAQGMDNRPLKKECAEILESMKQYSEAAMMYESANYIDRATSLYIKMKNWGKVGELVAQCTSPRLQLQYAKAKEADGSYQEAAKAYALAQEYDSVIRIYLDHLNNPEAAVAVVKETKSLEGAKMVAKFFQRLNDVPTAIQFLALSRCHQEAFQLAQSSGQMEVYAEVVEGGSPRHLAAVAQHYETQRSHTLAGKFYARAGMHKQAIHHLLKEAHRDSEAVSLAIGAVAAANDPHLTSQLIAFLMGETDGEPKDFRYLFRLYMALGRFRDAGKTAIIIAREEQIAGNYKNAHSLLLSMYRELQKHHIRPPAEMAANLMVLHSYTLVKLHVRRGDHLKSARMLIRVANNISKFPMHVVPLLTSTVIECNRSGLKDSAFSHAALLMRPEYRNQIDPKYRKKMEAIVRKPQRGEEEEPLTPCPYCGGLLPETELMCPQCRNTLPYCIVTGRHILREDLTKCPGCEFPAIRSEFIPLSEDGESCPMCCETFPPDVLVQLDDPRQFLLAADSDD